MDKVKVYYNSACPVCKAGIEDQQCRMGAQEVTDVVWLDIHSNSALADELGTDLEAVREQLHVKNTDGSIHVGVGIRGLVPENCRAKMDRKTIGTARDSAT